jgi:hypothetical protein
MKTHKAFTKEDQKDLLFSFKLLFEACFKKYPKADPESLGNFVTTATHNLNTDKLNLLADTLLYGWNKDTSLAIYWCLLRLESQ